MGLEELVQMSTLLKLYSNSLQTYSHSKKGIGVGLLCQPNLTSKLGIICTFH